MTMEPSAKHKLMILGKILFSGFVLWILIRTSQLKFELFANFLFHPFLFVSAIVMFLAMVFMNTWRWYRLNAMQGIPLSLGRTVMPTYIGTAYNSLLPGAVGGDFVRLYYLFKKIPDKKSTSLLSVLFDRITGLMGIFITVSFIAAIHASFFKYQPALFYLLLVCAAFCLAGLALFFVSMMLPQRIGVSDWLSQRFPHKNWTRPILSFLEGVRIYRNAKLVIVECLMISVIIQIFMVVTILIIAKMMGIPPIGFSDYAIAIGATQIVNLIPATPGGIGIGEMAFANVLLLLNPGVSAAFATIFLAYRLIGVVAYLPAIVCSISSLKFYRTELLVRK